MKRICALVLALVLCLGLCVPALAADFSDVPADYWAYSAIQNAAEKGITSGYSDSMFKPSANVTNIQFMVMLTRAFYAEDVAKWTASPAAAKNEWWWPNWYALTSRNLLVGSELFNGRNTLGEQGNAGITRYDMAWLLAAVLKDMGGFASEEQKAGAQTQITDYASIPAENQEAVKTVFALGLITGYSDGTFGGSRTMNRAQGCIVIDRLAQYVGVGTGTVSAVPVGDDLANMPTSPGNTQADQDASTNAENGTLTLRDGSAVTEANALKIINEILQVYPHGTTWKEGTARNANIMIGGRQLGSVSTACNNTISNNYFTPNNRRVSMTTACGGFASLISDAIFGGGNNGGENFPARKLDSVANVRPGDIIVSLNAKGEITHVQVAASTATLSKTDNGVNLYKVTQYEGNNGESVTYGNGTVFDTPRANKGGVYFEAWTRYPD